MAWMLLTNIKHPQPCSADAVATRLKGFHGFWAFKGAFIPHRLSLSDQRTIQHRLTARHAHGLGSSAHQTRISMRLLGACDVFAQWCGAA
eukprot:1137669-Pelagomonas_calceolata.AAC.2